MIPGTSYKKLVVQIVNGQAVSAKRHGVGVNFYWARLQEFSYHYCPGLAILEYDWVCGEILTPRVSALWKYVIWKLKSGGDHSLQITPWTHLKWSRLLATAQLGIQLLC